MTEGELAYVGTQVRVVAGWARMAVAYQCHAGAAELDYAVMRGLELECEELLLTLSSIRARECGDLWREAADREWGVGR